MKKLIIGVVAIALVAAGIFFLRDRIPQAAEVQAAAPAQASSEMLPVVRAPEQVIVEARVVPRRQAALGMTASGIVSQVYVANGDQVAAGDVLAELRNARQSAAVAQAEANLRNAQLQLAELTASPRSEEIARYQAAIVLAQASLQKVLDGASNADIVAARTRLASAAAARQEAQAAYDKVSWRNDIGMLPQSTALQQATNDYTAAEAQLNDLLAGPRRADVVRAQAEIAAAQADLDLFLAGATDEAVAAAEANVAAAQAALLDAQAALEETILRAPFAGTVAAINVEVGEQVSPGLAVVHLADVGAWRIETADMSELNVVNVQPGDQVLVTFDALPDVNLRGRLVQIEPIGENIQGDITYTGVVELMEQEPRLRWNMTAQTTITPDLDGRAAYLQGGAAPQGMGLVDAIRAKVHATRGAQAQAAATQTGQ